MSLAVRGIEVKIVHGDTFHNDRFPDLKAGCIPTNPPLDVSDWSPPAPSVARQVCGREKPNTGRLCPSSSIEDE
jgi:hypothetical protein